MKKTIVMKIVDQNPFELRSIIEISIECEYVCVWVEGIRVSCVVKIIIIERKFINLVFTLFFAISGLREL